MSLFCTKLHLTYGGFDSTACNCSWMCSGRRTARVPSSLLHTCCTIQLMMAVLLACTALDHCHLLQVQYMYTHMWVLSYITAR
jgi:hypothetical protein